MGTNQYQLQFTIANPYQIVMNVSCLFVLDPLLSAGRPGQTYSSQHLMTDQLPLRTINRELYFTFGIGSWGGGAYYLGGAGCMQGNTVIRTEPKASQTTEFAINRPTTTYYVLL